MGLKILIIDNDKSFVSGLKYNLEQDDHNIEVLTKGKELTDLIINKHFDLVLLDLELPDVNGLNICKNIRKQSSVPIIILTKKNEDMDKILALEYGADDFLVKPFNILELKARIKAIFRRMNYCKVDTDTHIIEVNDFVINTLTRKIIRNNEDINLTGKEFDLFYALITNPGKVFTRERLLELVWGYAYYGDLRTVDVHIRRIREKIESNTKDTQYILTKWGEGYYFTKNI
jgi:DNA-binding response OmpR family regulator